MSFFDLLHLSMRNLREAKLRATLTSMGVIVGVAVIVTMVSFGLGLQRNLLSRFKALDLFNEMSVYGKNIAVVAVDPGLTLTERLAANPPPGMDMSRANSPDVTAKTVAFICRDPMAFTGRVYPAKAFVDDQVVTVCAMNAHEAVVISGLADGAVVGRNRAAGSSR